MLLKIQVLERLERIVDTVNVRSDFEIMRGEEAMGGETAYAALGFAVGARFVRDMILDEFDFLFPDEEYIDEVDEYNTGDDIVEVED